MHMNTNIYLPPAFDCGGLENREASVSAGGAAGDDGCMSPPVESSTRLLWDGGEETSPSSFFAFLALRLAVEKLCL